MVSRSLNDLIDDLATAERTAKELRERLRSSAPTAVVDESAFRPATECLCIGRFESYRQLLAVLKANPSIRTRKPSRFRLRVHTGELIAYVARMNVAEFEAGTVSVSAAAHLADEVRGARKPRFRSAR